MNDKDLGKDKYGVTNGQIDAWKAAHGEVALIEVPEYDAHFYIRKAKRADISQAIANSQSDTLKYGETLCANLWIGGDERFKSTESTDFQFKRAAAPQVGEWVKAAEATLKKL